MGKVNPIKMWVIPELRKELYRLKAIHPDKTLLELQKMLLKRNKQNGQELPNW